MDDVVSSSNECDAEIRKRSKKDLLGYWISFGVIVSGAAGVFIDNGAARAIGAVAVLVGVVVLLIFAVRAQVDQWRWQRLQRANDLDQSYEQRDKFI